MEIKVLGPGCLTCEELTTRVELAVEQLGIQATVHHVHDYETYATYGILFTPGLVIDKDGERAVRVTYKPTLQKQIAESAFMQQRAAGISPDEISEEDQMELVDLVWNAPESDILAVGPVFDYPYNWLPEVMGFAKCEQCGELVAHAYRRVVGDKILCIPCSGYDR
jgi:hypothetical protein